MARLKKRIQQFSGMVTIGDSKDIPDTMCYRQKNMVSEDGLVKTRQGCIKLNSTALAGPITLIYNFKRRPSTNKTIVGVGGSIYYI